MILNNLHISNKFLRLFLYLILLFISFVLFIPKQEKKRSRSNSVYSETTFENDNLNIPLFNTDV